jgi:hypothetical protein
VLVAAAPVTRYRTCPPNENGSVAKSPSTCRKVDSLIATPPAAAASATRGASSTAPPRASHVCAPGSTSCETQVPNPPFGLASYQGDIQTDAHGVGVGDFIGIFSKETFIVAPGTAPAPVVFHNAPFPDANTNPKTGPVHTYHLGLWFGSPASAAHAGCANTPTPFNGTHTAGIQAMSTRNFPDLAGPLFNAP